MGSGLVSPQERPIAAPTAMGVLSRLVAQRVDDAGIAIEPLLAAVGLSPNLIAEPKHRIRSRVQIDFINLAAKVLDDPLLGFHLALDCDLRAIGPLYYVMASADTLGEAFRRECRYVSTMNESIRITRRRTAGVTIDLEYQGVERHRDVHQVEFWQTATLRKVRLLTGVPVVPLLGSFVHRRFDHVAEMNDYFGVPLEYGAAHDRLSFDTAVAELPVLTADPYLSAFLVSYYEDIMRVRPLRSGSVRIQVENAVVPRLPHGTATITHVAKDLGMSCRTLTRRLAQEGQSFRMILNDLRCDLAERYLIGRDLSTAETAWLLGYRDMNAFVRAYKQRTGQSPTEWRRTYGTQDAKADETVTHRS